MTAINDTRRKTTTPSSQPLVASHAPPAPGDDDVEDIDAIARSGDGPTTGSVDRSSRSMTGATIEGGDGASMGRLPGAQRAASSTFASVQQARARIERDFGVVVVDGPWRLEELSRVHESLQLAGKTERRALKGVELRREATPTAAIVERHDGNVGAFFDRGDKVDDDGNRLSPPSITFYDAGFPDTGDARRDRRTSMHVALHELGHVIEGHAIGDALAETNGGAVVEKAANDAEKRLTGDYAISRALLTTGLSPVPAGLLDAVATFEAAHRKISAETSSPAKREEALSTLQAAHARAQKILAGMADDDPTRERVAAFVGLQAEIAALQPGFVEGSRRADHGENLLKKLVVTRDVKETPHDETTGRLEGMLDDALGEREAMPTLGEVSPVEDFANAYALYRRDPDALKAESPIAWKFFRKRLP